MDVDQDRRLNKQGSLFHLKYDIMKTIKNLLIALAMFAAYNAFGQQTIPPAEPSALPNPDFTVDLIVDKCSVFESSVMAVVRTANRQMKVHYTFQWMVDAVPAGTDYRIDCTRGKYVTVYVTQHPLGRRVTKTIRLRRTATFEKLPLAKAKVM